MLQVSLKCLNNRLIINRKVQHWLYRHIRSNTSVSNTHSVSQKFCRSASAHIAQNQTCRLHHRNNKKVIQGLVGKSRVRLPSAAAQQAHQKPLTSTSVTSCGMQPRDSTSCQQGIRTPQKHQRAGRKTRQLARDQQTHLHLTAHKHLSPSNRTYQHVWHQGDADSTHFS